MSDDLVPGRAADASRRRGPRRDALAAVVGCLALLVGGALLWHSLVAPLTLASLKIAIPSGLVVVGVLGLVLSRH